MDDLDAKQPGHLQAPRGHRRWFGGFKPSKKTIIIVVILATVVIVLGGGVTWWLGRESGPPAEQSTGQQQAEEANEEPSMPAAEAALPQTYKSEALNIEFIHRKDWTVSESAENKRITVRSPNITYTTAEGQSKRGVFTLSFAIGASSDAKQAINNATAVKDSLLIAYDTPTEAQRFYTNVSYAGPSETAFAFFIVTGSVALKVNDPLAGSIIIGSADFLIDGGFGEDAENRLAFDTLPATSFEQYPVYDQALAIVKSLKVY